MDHYGWRARIAFLCPSMDDVVSCEFRPMIPEGVIIFSISLGIQNLTQDQFEAAMAKVEETALMAAREDVAGIVVGGTPPIIAHNLDGDLALIERVRRLTGMPASTTATAEVNALRALGLRRIAMATPIGDHLNRRLKEFLEHKGFAVVAMKGLGIQRNAELAQLPFSASYDLAKEVYASAPEAEGIFIECPRWPVVRNIDRLERELGVPVVASAQAIVWECLNLAGVREPVSGYGRLMAS